MNQLNLGFATAKGGDKFEGKWGLDDVRIDPIQPE